MCFEFVWSTSSRSAPEYASFKEYFKVCLEDGFGFKDCRCQKKNILQFKFNSRYQMEWVEVMVHGILTIIFYSCAGGQRGYQSIIFHSPIPHFGFKYRGLPFESMFEEVGRDLGNRLGKYIESDKRSWLLEQAKFMRIRVDLPINKPLRRGGNIVNSDGEKYWVTFKYERLPSFCYFFPMWLSWS